MGGSQVGRLGKPRRGERESKNPWGGVHLSPLTTALLTLDMHLRGKGQLMLPARNFLATVLVHILPVVVKGREGKSELFCM